MIDQCSLENLGGKKEKMGEEKDIVDKQVEKSEQEKKDERYIVEQEEKERGIHLYFPETGRYGEILLKFHRYGKEKWEVKCSILSRNASLTTCFSDIEPYLDTGLLGDNEPTISSYCSCVFSK